MEHHPTFCFPQFLWWIFCNSLAFLEQNHNETASKFAAKGRSNAEFLFQQWEGILDSFTFWQDLSSNPAWKYIFFGMKEGHQKSVAENTRQTRKSGRKEHWRWKKVFWECREGITSLLMYKGNNFFLLSLKDGCFISLVTSKAKLFHRQIKITKEILNDICIISFQANCFI